MKRRSINCTIGLMALVAAASGARAQTPARAPRITSPEEVQRNIEALQREWSQANTVLLEAARRLSPCSPRLVSLLVQVRDSAAALAQANSRYIALYATAARMGNSGDREFPARARTAVERIGEATDVLQRERALIQAKRAALPPADSADLDSLLANVEALNPAASAATTGVAALASQTQEAVAERDALLKQLEATSAAEAKFWNAYYDGVEADIRRQCIGAQTRPTALPPKTERRP